MILLIDKMKKVIPAICVVATALTISAATPDFGRMVDNLAAKIDGVKTESATLSADKAALKAEVAPADPEVEFEYLWPSSAGELNRWSAGVSQELPDFRKMAATRRVVRSIDTLDILVRSVSRTEAVYEAEQRLITLIGAHRELAMLREIHRNLDSLTVAYTRAWEKGEVNILDLNKIKIEHARASAADDEAGGKVAALTAEIITLSGGTISADDLAQLDDYPMYQLPTDGHGCSDKEGMMEGVVRRSPQARMLTAREAVLDSKIDLASKNRFPRLTLGYVHAYEDGTHFNGLSAGLSLPVFSRKSTVEAAVCEAYAEKSANEQKLNAMIAEANAACARAHTLAKLLSKMGPAVGNSNNERLLRMALDGGEITLLQYLQELSYFVEAGREYEASRLEYALILSSLARWSE